jgi:hypothetical protein
MLTPTPPAVPSLPAVAAIELTEFPAAPNVPLLRATFAVIKNHPEHWDQGDWRCSTGMCFAGWASVIAGAEFVVPHALLDSLEPLEVQGHRVNPQGIACLVRHPLAEHHCCVVSTSASERLVALTGMRVNAFAQQALGLTEDQADALFDSGNSLPTLERMVEILIEDGADADLDGAGAGPTHYL